MAGDLPRFHREVHNHDRFRGIAGGREDGYQGPIEIEGIGRHCHVGEHHCGLILPVNDHRVLAQGHPLVVLPARGEGYLIRDIAGPFPVGDQLEFECGGGAREPGR